MTLCMVTIGRLVRKIKENCRFWKINCKKITIVHENSLAFDIRTTVVYFRRRNIVGFCWRFFFLLIYLFGLFKRILLYQVTTVYYTCNFSGLSGFCRKGPRSCDLLLPTEFKIHNTALLWVCCECYVRFVLVCICQFHLFDFFLDTWWLYWCYFHCFECLFDFCCCWISYLIFCTMC